MCVSTGREFTTPGEALLHNITNQTRNLLPALSTFKANLVNPAIVQSCLFEIAALPLECKRDQVVETTSDQTPPNGAAFAARVTAPARGAADPNSQSNHCDQRLLSESASRVNCS